MTDATAIRAINYPLQDVEVLLANTEQGRRVKVQARMCKAHATLWNGLTEPQQSAGEYVSRCWHVIHGSPTKAVNWARVVEPSGHSINAEFEQMLRADYKAWQIECMHYRINFEPAVMQCARGESFSSITRSGAKLASMTEQLHLALDVMAKLKGWK